MKKRADLDQNNVTENSDGTLKRSYLPSLSLSWRISLITAGIVLGIWGYARAERSPAVGVALLVFMMVLVALAFWRVEEVGSLDEEAGRLGTIWRVILASEPRATVLLLLALAQNLGTLLVLHRDQKSGWGIVFWLGSIVTLVFGVGYSAWPASLELEEVIKRAKRKFSLSFALEAAVLLGLTGLAFVLRAMDLQRYPPMVHGDEGELGVVALGILEGTARVSPFTTLWAAQPTMFNYWQALFMEVFGINVAGLRMLSAITGTLSVFLLYFLARVWFGRFAATASALLLTVSHLHIHYSRLGLPNVHSAFFVTLVLLLLAIARIRRSTFFYTLSGLAGGYSLYFYVGSRVIPLLMVVLLAFLLVERRASICHVLACMFAFWLAFAPLALWYLNHPDAFSGRTSAVFAFSERNFKHVLGVDQPAIQDYLALLRFQVRRTLAFFVREGDVSSFYFRDIPAFDVVSCFLFWLGMGVVAINATKFPQFSLLSWFLLVIILGGMLTNDPPNSTRLIVGAQAVPIFGGVFLAQLRDFARRLVGVRLDRAFVPALLVLSAGTLYLNFHLYFVEYARKTPGRQPIEIAWEMVHKDAGYRFYLLGDPGLYVEHGVIRFVARDVEKANILRRDPLPSDLGGTGAVFFFLPNNMDRLQQLKALYPRGEFREFRDPLERLIFAEYIVPAVKLPNQ